MTYPAGTKGWLKYAHSNAWWSVEVLYRHPGTNTYDVRRARTDFTVGNRDILIVVRPSA